MSRHRAVRNLDIDGAYELQLVGNAKLKQWDADELELDEAMDDVDEFGQSVPACASCMH